MRKYVKNEVDYILQETQHNICNLKTTDTLNSFNDFLCQAPELFVTLDRYSGTYSHALWTAWLCKPVSVFLAFENDVDCGSFWAEASHNPQLIVGKGYNPHAALFDLYRQIKLTLNKQYVKLEQYTTELYQFDPNEAYDATEYPLTIIALEPNPARLWMALYDEPNELYPPDIEHEQIKQHFFQSLNSKAACLQYYPEDAFELGNTPNDLATCDPETLL